MDDGIGRKVNIVKDKRVPDIDLETRFLCHLNWGLFSDKRLR